MVLTLTDETLPLLSRGWGGQPEQREEWHGGQQVGLAVSLVVCDQHAQTRW
eukprot:COSAG06_NODE_8613_length_2114_cov_2.450893_4_plen_50_part_01